MTQGEQMFLDYLQNTKLPFLRENDPQTAKEVEQCIMIINRMDDCLK